MNKSIPIAYVILIAAASLILGIVISPYIPSIPTDLPQVTPPQRPDSNIVSPDDSTVVITSSPDDKSIYCNWCGDECVELGSRNNCPEVMPDNSQYWCGTVTINGQETCQKTPRTAANEGACDAFNACDNDESCYSYPNQGFGRCVGQDENPCQFCPSQKCQVSPETIYPAKVICQ